MRKLPENQSPIIFGGWATVSRRMSAMLKSVFLMVIMKFELSVLGSLALTLLFLIFSLIGFVIEK